jgi:hypothetical protein
MTTRRAPQTAEEHTAEARRLLTLTRPEGLTPTEFNEYLTFDNSTAIVAAANVHATLALVEEQRTANLIAAYNGDLLKNPYEVGTHENNDWWVRTCDAIKPRLAVEL